MTLKGGRTEVDATARRHFDLLRGSFTLHATPCSIHFNKIKKNEIRSIIKLFINLFITKLVTKCICIFKIPSLQWFKKNM